MDQVPEKAMLQNAKGRLATLKEDLNQAIGEDKERPRSDEDDRRQLLLGFANLLSEPKLDFELVKQYSIRKDFKAMFLGVVKLEEADIRVINLLKEPTELVLTIPVDAVVCIDLEEHENEATGAEYYLFGTDKLFCIERNDTLPMDFSPTSMRTAQRDLMAILRRDPRNHATVVSKPTVPTSVAIRGTSEDRLGDLNKYFDLGELVRDCNYPVDNMPTAETPERLAENGLELRNYQKTSLQWLLDKETNASGLGTSGQWWSRMRGLNENGAQTFYYCELTGSILLNIFNYASDVDQGDASINQGDSFPSSSIIASGEYRCRVQCHIRVSLFYGVCVSYNIIALFLCR